MPDPAFMEIVREQMNRFPQQSPHEPWTRNPGHLPPGGTTWEGHPPVNLPGEVVPSRWGLPSGDTMPGWGGSESWDQPGNWAAPPVGLPPDLLTPAGGMPYSPPQGDFAQYNRTNETMPPQGSDNSGLRSFANVTDQSLTDETDPYSNTAGQAKLRQYAFDIAQEVGIDPWMFIAQIQRENRGTPEGTWRTNAVSGAGAEGVAQVTPRWHPQTLLDLVRDYRITDENDPRSYEEGNRYFTEAEAKELQGENSPFQTKPFKALKYAAKLMWARMAIFRHKNRYDATTDDPESRNSFKWRHNPAEQRSVEDTKALRDAQFEYNVGHPESHFDPKTLEGARNIKEGRDYGRQISSFLPVLREQLYGLAHPDIGDATSDEWANRPVGPTFSRYLDTADVRPNYVPGRVWIMRSGETLSGVSEKTNVPLKDLMEANGVKDKNEIIYAGRHIRIPPTG